MRPKFLGRRWHDQTKPFGRTHSLGKGAKQTGRSAHRAPHTPCIAAGGSRRHSLAAPRRPKKTPGAGGVGGGVGGRRGRLLGWAIRVIAARQGIASRPVRIVGRGQGDIRRSQPCAASGPEHPPRHAAASCPARQGIGLGAEDVDQVCDVELPHVARKSGNPAESSASAICVQLSQSGADRRVNSPRAPPERGTIHACGGT